MDGTHADATTTPATRDAILRGILKPEVVKPSTPDLRLAQNATGVNEAAQSITAADELLAKLKQVEKTLRVEVEQVEEALRKLSRKFSGGTRSAPPGGASADSTAAGADEASASERCSTPSSKTASAGQWCEERAASSARARAGILGAHL